MVSALYSAVVILALLCTACALDPEVNYDAIQLITSKGYPAETHWVTTHDGYILAMHRIPHPKNDSSKISRPVVFLQHGLLCSSTNWLTNLANESFAYLLADAGFDVWMGNIRGNTYSRNHTILSPNEKPFWNFTFDQHALIDLPTMLDKALQVSQQQKLFYVGHSQGTIMGFAGFTANKTLGGLVKAFFAYAPVATIQYIEGGFRLVTDFYKWIEYLLDIIGHGEFVPHDALLDFLAKHVCDFDIVAEDVCEDVLFLLCGFDKNNTNITRLPVYYTHTPAGTSVKNAAHYAQEVRSGKFEMYDYGSPEENARHYHGLPHPPEYNVTELKVPTALFYGGQDWLADPRDVSNLIPKISDTVFFKKNISYYNHLDFIWGLDAAIEVYDVTINLMKKRV